LAHRFDGGTERDMMSATAVECESGGGRRLDRCDAVAFDARELDQSSDVVTRQPEMVLDRDLGGDDARSAVGGRRDVCGMQPPAAERAESLN
jgi:hypothetical protein